MKFEATPHFNQRLQKKLKKQPAVKEKISKQLKLLAKISSIRLLRFTS